MPPVKDLSKLTKEDLLKKCREYNLPVGTLTKRSRTSLECKVRCAMNEERAKKSNQANEHNNSKEATIEPKMPRSVRPSRIPVLLRSYSNDELAPLSPRVFLDDPNDSGIQLTRASDANEFQGIPNQWESLRQLRRSLMEDMKDFEDKELLNPEQVMEEELPLSDRFKRQLKSKFNLNESENEDEEFVANTTNAAEEEDQKQNNFQSKWVSAVLVLVAAIIFYNIWEKILY